MTVIVGLMVCSDMLGITSVIRDLSLDSALYNSMMHFFRADSRAWEDIFTTWVQTVSRYAPLKRIPGRAVLVGDESVSHIVQMLREGFRAAQHIGRSLFVLDRYFLTKSMLLEWQVYSAEPLRLLHVVTRAKRNCTAYERYGPYKGWGRRPVRGDAVPTLCVTGQGFPKCTAADIWGRKGGSFPIQDKLQGLYQALQFVLVEYGQTQAILVCTNLSMSAEDIITTYTYRFKIEAMFREMKQD